MDKVEVSSIEVDVVGQVPIVEAFENGIGQGAVLPDEESGPFEILYPVFEALDFAREMPRLRGRSWIDRSGGGYWSGDLGLWNRSWNWLGRFSLSGEVLF